MRFGLAVGLAFIVSACVYDDRAPGDAYGPAPADSYYQGLCEARAAALETEPDATMADGFEPAVDWLTGQCAALGFDMRPSPTKVQTETFGALTNYIGNAYKGVSTHEGDAQITDFQYWSWALGGTAILIQHVISDGSYGGDTYVYKDAKSEKLVYVYITNAGFRTEGEMQVLEGGTYTAEEAVTGHETITRVRSTSVLNEDGTSVMTSQYYDAGKWVAGPGFTYAPTDEPLPLLKPQSAIPEVLEAAETAPQ